jgi:hypothetical protein
MADETERNALDLDALAVSDRYRLFNFTRRDDHVGLPMGAAGAGPAPEESVADALIADLSASGRLFQSCLI